MARFTDALRKYGFQIHKRDNFKCRYCGLDGTLSFANWLSWDHLLPKGHPQRDNLDYIVTARKLCNTADNRYFDLAAKRGLRFDGLTQDTLVTQRLHYIQLTRTSYRAFRDAEVRPKLVRPHRGFGVELLLRQITRKLES
jgi:hypothetical protein